MNELSKLSERVLFTDSASGIFDKSYWKAA